MRHPRQTVWVASAYLLAVTTSLFTISSLGQSRGSTRTWGYGVAVFTFGSLLCAVSTTFPLLIVARVLQGCGAAAIMSLSPALVRDIYPRSLLGHAFGLNAMYTNIAAAAGPTVGGLLLAVLPWQWLFAINIPIAAVIVVLARGTLPVVPGTGAPLDPISMATSAAGFSLLVYGLDGFARGDAPSLILAELAIGAVLFAWFVRRQFTLPMPMISLDLFRLPRFSVAAQASFTGWSAWSIGVIALPFFLQLDFGMTPLHAGLLMTSWPIANAAIAPITGRWSDRYAVGWIATGGLVIFTFALLLFAFAVTHPSIALLLIAGIVAGVGWGIFQTPNNREIMGSGPPEKGGSVAAIFASLRVAGQTFGRIPRPRSCSRRSRRRRARTSHPKRCTPPCSAHSVLRACSALIATFVSAQRAFRDGFHYQQAR